MIKDIKGMEWKLVGMVGKNVAVVRKARGTSNMIATVKNGVIIGNPEYAKAF